MLQEDINIVLNKMSSVLDNRQMIKLNRVLEDLLHENADMIPRSSQALLESFIATKRLEGRSEQTLELYRNTVERMLAKFDKNVCVFSTDDVREYLADYQRTRGINKSTMDNMRRNLSSFFKWLEDENYIFKSPMRRSIRSRLRR